MPTRETQKRAHEAAPAAPDVSPDRPVPADPQDTAAPRHPEPRTRRGRRWADRLGRWLVSAGGFAIIASILAILVFIAWEAAPLLGGAQVSPESPISVPALRGAAVIGDAYRSAAAALGRDGHLYVVRNGAAARDLGPVAPEFAAAGGNALDHIVVLAGQPAFAAVTTDGRIAIVRITWDSSVEDGVRTSTPSFATSLIEHGGRAGAFTAAATGDGPVTVAAQHPDGTLVLVQAVREKNAITGEETASQVRHDVPAPPLTALAIDGAARQAWGGTAGGDLLYWPLEDGVPGPAVRASAGQSAITALAFLIGDRALVVGQADGSLSVWFLVADRGGRHPVRVRDFPRAPGPIELIAPSPRDKGFLAQDASGRLGLYYSTSHRTLWTGASPVPHADGLAFTPKADGALVIGDGRLAAIRIHNPHPEVSLEALFGKVWYEGASRPEFVWQSSSGSDDFEPKLGMTPLLVGTLKGTFYSLVLAIPIGVLGAMYTSQFMHPRLKKVVKPVVEIMAALPSVVLGFLAGLWLAPRLEAFFPALLLMGIALPAMSLAAAGAYHLLPLRLRSRLLTGSEALLAIVFLAAGMWASIACSGAVERALFGGRFPGWLLNATGLGYDQRNAIVVGIAMGFAVIPIIFSVSEEAFSNVPRGLVAGSLALGATRWQTVTQVVLPSASAGIFSAIMIGFGRAVGETMIVLMATGNTPITSWNPFNGFRTLSANVAVEIPEAPHGGTLYRTLFLAGLLLFALTFAVNTVAEIVRQRLRRRYQGL